MRRKVLVAASEYPPMVGSGASLVEAFVDELVEEPDVELHLWAPEGSDIPRRGQLHDSVRRPRGIADVFATTVRNAWTLRGLMRRHRFDAIAMMDSIVNSYGLPFVPTARTLAYVRGDGRFSAASLVTERLTGRMALERAALAKVKLIVGNARATLDRMQTLPEDIEPRVVHPCYDPHRIYDPRRHVHRPGDIPDSVFVFTTVSRLTPGKGHDLVLELLAAARSRLPPFHYVIVGDGPCRASLRKQARQLGLADQVTFTASVPLEDLGAYYGHSDLFLLLADPGAGFGLAIAEAEASGVPLMVTRFGGVSEVVRHDETGWVIHATEPKAAQDALVALVADEDRRRRYAEEAKRRALREQSPSAFARSLLASLLP